MAVEIIKILLGIGLGFFIHYILLTPKIEELTNTIRQLSKTVDKLENKVEDVKELRKELYALEIRVSDNTSEIKRLDKERA